MFCNTYSPEKNSNKVWFNLTLKCQLHKMVKHSHTIRRQQPTSCLNVFDHFVGLAPKRVNRYIFSPYLVINSLQFDISEIIWIKLNSKLRINLNFLYCHLAVTRPTLGHSRGGSLIKPMLITALVQLWPENHREHRNGVGSLSPAERQVGFELRTSRF